MTDRLPLPMYKDHEPKTCTNIPKSEPETSNSKQPAETMNPHKANPGDQQIQQVDFDMKNENLLN